MVNTRGCKVMWRHHRLRDHVAVPISRPRFLGPTRAQHTVAVATHTNEMNSVGSANRDGLRNSGMLWRKAEVDHVLSVRGTGVSRPAGCDCSVVAGAAGLLERGV